MQQSRFAAICGAIMLCAACCADSMAEAPRRSPIRPAKLPAVKRAAVKLQVAPAPTTRPASSSPAQHAVSPPAQHAVSPPTQPAPPVNELAISPSARADQPVQLASGESLLVPIEVQAPAPDVDLSGEDGLVTLVASGADLPSVLRMIADHHQLNLVLGPDVAGPVTVSIRGARLEEVLDAILGVAGFAWHRVNNLLYVTGAAAMGMDPRVQGRTLQVYRLDYVSAVDVEAVVNGLLSPVGHAYISQADAADQLRTREMLVVEDTQAAHTRIAQYISQIDIPPRQVLVEAHVLQVALTEEERHGINLKALTRLEGSAITLQGSGFADDSSSSEPQFTLRVSGNDMESVIELIRQHTNSRTLASPKVSVVNHQEAKIQIGQRLPYSVATTTQTSTIQTVEFLEVGIVLTVRPIITADGNVLMYVLPKVSGGKITQNGFPEEETTEVQTTIMIPDGGGVIIGGLIREENLGARAMVPFFGKIPIVGGLFRRRSDECRRNELIVALVTHVMPDGCGPRSHEVMELEKALPDYAVGEFLHETDPVIEYPTLLHADEID